MQDMTWGHRIGIIVVLTLLGYLRVGCQPADFPELTWRSVEVLSIDNGLPTTCFDQVFIDSSGRMWLIPCKDSQQNRQLNLIQYDGHVGRVIDLDMPIGTSVVVAEVVGDSLLYGVALEANDVFIYHINADTTEIIHLEEVNVEIYGLEIIGERLFVLGYEGRKHLVFEYENNEMVLIDSQLADVRIDKHRTELIDNISVSDDEYIWYTANTGTIYGLNIGTGQRLKFPVDTVSPESSHQIRKVGDRVLYYSHGPVAVVKEILPSGTEPVELLPAGWSYFYGKSGAHNPGFLFQDLVGNLMVTCQDPEGKIHALLVMSNGKTFDVTKTWRFNNQELVSQFGSRDFMQGMWTMSGETRVFSMTPKFGFLRSGKDPCRALGQMDNGNLVVLTDAEPFEVRMNQVEAIRGDSLPYSAINIPASFERRNIIADRNSSIWVASSTTLHEYTPATGELTSTFIDDEFEYFYEYGANFILIADGNVYVYDPDNAVALAADYRNQSEVEGRVNQMAVADSIGWIVSSSGVWRFDIRTNELTKFSPEVLEDFRFLSVHCDNSDLLWLGTESNGVLRFDLRRNEYKKISTGEGLSNNTVVGLLVDDKGNIWTSTFWGISVLSNDGEVLAKYYARDGIALNEGNRWSQRKLADGRLVFGSVGGITIVDPEYALGSFNGLSLPTTYISSIGYFDSDGEEVSIWNPTRQDLDLTIPNDHRSLEVNTGISDYSSVLQNEYAYRFDNSEEWVSVGSNPKLIFPNLAPGKYSLLIRGRDVNGKWSENTVRLNLYVKNSFFSTAWFYLLCTLPFIAFGGLWYWRNRRERQRLEAEVANRTAEISRQADELREADRAKTRIYTNITHEFRTPLTVISGVADGVEDPKRQSVLKRNSGRMLNLVNQLLDLSKLQSGHLKSNPRKLDVMALARDIVGSFEHVADSRGLALHFHAEPNRVIADLDPEIMHRILGNLVSNAIKFTSAGGNIYVTFKVSGNQLEFSVRDTGVGIDQTELSNVFSRFYQIDDSSTRPEEGTGIGLALTKELVDFISGQISVTSQLNEGTTFNVALPLLNESEGNIQEFEGSKGVFVQLSELTQESTVAVEANDSDTRPNVLLVEDNPDVLNYLISCLREDYQLDIATNGEEGIEKAMTNVPDLIISDVMMPIKDGFELCEHIKQAESTNHIHVILLTARVDAESRLKGLGKGADAYLAKPFDREELLLQISNLIETRKQIHSKYRDLDLASSSPSKPQNEEEIFMGRLNQLVIDHIDDEDFGVAHLCRALKYGKTQLYSKVKAYTGMSVSAYIKLKRMQRAKSMLESGKHTVAEVAYAVGFRDPSYFTKIFRAEYGATPSSFANDPNRQVNT